jgi:hypothetical protein
MRFRVWCKTIKTFSTQPSISSDGLQLIWHHTGDVISISNLDDGDYVVQWYTDTDDNYGIPIYEGDVVQTVYPDNLQVGVVIYSPDLGGYRIKCKNNVLIPLKTYRFLEGQPTGIMSTFEKVIGNIFVTPDCDMKTRKSRTKVYSDSKKTVPTTVFYDDFNAFFTHKLRPDLENKSWIWSEVESEILQQYITQLTKNLS